MPTLDQCELVDDQPIICIYIIKIEKPDFIADDAAIFMAIFNIDAVNEEFMNVNFTKTRYR